MSPRLYTDYAAWWPLFADPTYYAAEAASIAAILRQELGHPARAILELGCGGGTLASFLKASAKLTLVDPEPRMLAVSRTLNPGCEHVVGDMRTVQLGRRFDAVVLHDAVNYMTTAEDLTRALETARAHLLPEGAVVVLPDDTEETFEPSTSTGGRDDEDGRGLRYLLWTKEPQGSTYAVDFAILLRDGDGKTDLLHERHMFGLFSFDIWKDAFRHAAFFAPCIYPDGRRQAVFCARPCPQAFGSEEPKAAHRICGLNALD
jgi:SAM-dependent methyltransferase